MDQERSDTKEKSIEIRLKQLQQSQKENRDRIEVISQQMRELKSTLLDRQVALAQARRRHFAPFVATQSSSAAGSDGRIHDSQIVIRLQCIRTTDTVPHATLSPRAAHGDTVSDSQSLASSDSASSSPSSATAIVSSSSALSRKRNRSRYNSSGAVANKRARLEDENGAAASCETVAAVTNFPVRVRMNQGICELYKRAASELGVVRENINLVWKHTVMPDNETQSLASNGLYDGCLVVCLYSGVAAPRIPQALHPVAPGPAAHQSALPASVAGAAAPNGKVSQDSKLGMLSITIKGLDGTEILFIVKPSTRIGKVMDAYCGRIGIDESSLRLLWDGNRLYREDTVAGIGMEDGDEIYAIINQTGS
jgi:Ubiquitin-2 like Rad60 SUMO-like